MSTSASAVLVRPLTSEDLDGYAAMVVAYYEADPGDLPMTWERARRQGGWILACAEAASAAEGGVPAGLPRAWAQRVSAWIVEVGGEVVGYLLLVPYFSNEFGGPIVYLDELYVREDRRGEGLGAAILSWIRDWCSAEGLLRVELEVHASNTSAERLYVRNGFQVGERRLLGMQVRQPDLGARAGGGEDG